MSFEITVLGCSGTYPVPGNAATGFLLRSDDSTIWIDAGTGTFANLQRHVDYRTLDAVLLSHLHLDHILDLFPLYYALRYSVEKLAPTMLQVFAPEEAESSLGAFVSKDRDPFGDYLVFRPIADGSIGGFDFSFVRARHPVPTFAMRIDRDGASFGYTADTAPSDAVTTLMKGV
ncbi:MAG TPA: MBL fold metallo-hydrolase, partial [Actinomycetota bacterium]|nr:MBL fold metallo-hydrolase [Actinomycetota bacterium]